LGNAGWAGAGALASRRQSALRYAVEANSGVRNFSEKALIELLAQVWKFGRAGGRSEQLIRRLYDIGNLTFELKPIRLSLGGPAHSLK
jgi:hypothetical protein